MEAAGASPSLQISAGYRLMLYKDIPPASLAVLLGLYQHASASFKGGDPMTVVANAMLNLDEIITKN
jgi:hypothetical protein